MNNTIQLTNRKAWRQWLSENHQKEKEIWLVYFKKHTGKPSVGYAESVEEALCFGWIDGIKKRIDEERYAHRFTPRKPKSRWSPRNIDLAEKLIQNGQMAPMGLASFDQRMTYGEDFLKTKETKEITLSAETEEALRANENAWKHFNNLSPGYKKQYVGWLQSAKKPETRKRRLEEAVKLLSENNKLGMK